MLSPNLPRSSWVRGFGEAIALFTMVAVSSARDGPWLFFGAVWVGGRIAFLNDQNTPKLVNCTKQKLKTQQKPQYSDF